jgi:flagellar hook-basal body complex protein FliE
MPVPPITPPITLGPEFSVPGLAQTAQPEEASGGSFGSALVEQLGKLGELEQDAATQSQALASGQAEDVTSVVMAVERASLALQLATQVRNKAVDAYHEIFRMQV